MFQCGILSCVEGIEYLHLLLGDIMYFSHIYKRALILGIIMAMPASLLADLIFDPITNKCYSSPVSPEINRQEYAGFWLSCIQIISNMIYLSDGIPVTKKEIMQQISQYLQKNGSPTALRLLADLQKGKIFYPDGSVAREIFPS